MTDGIHFLFLDFCHAQSLYYPFIWIARLASVAGEGDFSPKVLPVRFDISEGGKLSCCAREIKPEVD